MSDRTAAESLGYDTGSWRIPVVVSDVAAGTRGTSKQIRRADGMALIMALTPGMRVAAAIWRQSVHHVAAGIGMGPMPWAADVVRHGSGAFLWPQERALSAATWRRRGVDAMGLHAAQGVVQWVVIDGRSLVTYDANRGWRKGRACRELVSALTALAESYGCA